MERSELIIDDIKKIDSKKLHELVCSEFCCTIPDYFYPYYSGNHFFYGRNGIITIPYREYAREVKSVISRKNAHSFSEEDYEMLQRTKESFQRTIELIDEVIGLKETLDENELEVEHFGMTIQTVLSMEKRENIGFLPLVKDNILGGFLMKQEFGFTIRFIKEIEYYSINMVKNFTAYTYKRLSKEEVNYLLLSKDKINELLEQVDFLLEKQKLRMIFKQEKVQG